jgi:excisionase family DNA binding protein
MDNPDLMTPKEVAFLFGVNSKTVTRWTRNGKIPCFKTIGGHRRYRKVDVDRVLRETQNVRESSRSEVPDLRSAGGE